MDTELGKALEKAPPACRHRGTTRVAVVTGVWFCGVVEIGRNFGESKILFGFEWKIQSI